MICHEAISYRSKAVEMSAFLIVTLTLWNLLLYNVYMALLLGFSWVHVMTILFTEYLIVKYE